MTVEKLTDGMEYESDFDFQKQRETLGFDGHERTLRDLDLARNVANLLYRHGRLTKDEVSSLGFKVVDFEEADTPFYKGDCPEHGTWWFNSKGCMHADHRSVNGGSKGMDTFTTFGDRSCQR